MKRVQSKLQVGEVVENDTQSARVLKVLGCAVIAVLNTGEVCALVARVPESNGKQNHDIVLTLKRGKK